MSPKQIATENDHRILEVAYYHETAGMTKKLKDSAQLLDRFAEFKGLVRRGSFTIATLENKVFGQHGIASRPIDIYQSTIKTVNAIVAEVKRRTKEQIKGNEDHT